MGVSGGAVFPPIQGAIADAAGTRISYVVPLVGFVYVLGYVTAHWLRNGRCIRKAVQTTTEADASEPEKIGKESVVVLEVVRSEKQ